MNTFEALKLVIPPSVFSLLSFISTMIFVYVCIIAFSIILTLIVIALFYVICEFVRTPFYERSSNPDTEAGDQQRFFQLNNGSEWDDQATFYQATLLHNLRVLEILDSIVEALEERRDERQQREREQVLESKMPPAIAYGSQEIKIYCFLFLLGQAKLTTLSRLVVRIRNLALCTAALFLIALMHHIVGTILSWLPNRSHSDQEFEGGDDRFRHHHDQDTLPQAPAQDIVTLFHTVLMEVLDRVWEDLVMEEGQEQRPQALQVQALEALPPPLTYCKGGRDIASSCCSDRCTICLEDFVDGEFCRVFACKHMFHSDCIDHWLKNHLTCPICRNSVVDI
ncbi:hypothetical protein D8674_005401 [Pyrus ussuriensis x Pyrus communis]|uniref:RING-type E3 ubiquitin transferase n=1 Tax=Pyrus ussuriensis x Pyrus communis TaxID=2448454 RepID=A0A5N5G530_9ROSA|nr:hypothetical protein D8674_005401 [Pyrus ussuriensis x Pyrus communis]